MFKQDQKIEKLRDIEFFARCSMNDLRSIASTGDHVPVRKGDVLPSGAFYLLTSGEAAAGDSHLCPGDSVGAVGLLGGHEESGRMVTDGTVLVVGRREFATLMRRVPGFAVGVATHVVHYVGHQS